uniref:Variant surface glycoprotein 453 n=1 Tax=Trypanosoma brucei TaxID=5691 RepID=M4SV35_9TRYP|nr:variant surface glycoprotein 453 [Trypanosoma brucei]
MQQAQKKLLQMNILVKLLCVVCGRKVFGDKHELKEKTAETLCQFSGAAKAAAKTIATKMASAQSRLEEYRKLQMSLTLLAAENPGYAQACQLPATYAAYKAEQVNIVTRTLASRGALAAGASACSACRIDELFFTLHDPVSSSGRGTRTCIAPTAAAAFGANAFAGCKVTDFDTVGETTHGGDVAAMPWPSGSDYFADSKNCDFFANALDNRVGEAISAATLTAGGGIITITKDSDITDGGLATDKRKVAHIAEAIKQTDKIKTAMAQSLPPPLGTAADITEFLNGPEKTELAEIDKIISGANEAKDQTKMKLTIDTLFGAKADDKNRPFTKLLTTEAYTDKQDGVNKKVKLLELTETETTKQAVAKIMILNKQAADKTECQAAVITKSKPEEICNAIGDEDAKKCNETKNCHFVDKNDKGKKCTLKKDVKEKQEKASQTAGQDRKPASDRCTRHTKKEECEAENKNVKAGEKANCRWIEEKCKDFSFFVHKKLIMIAAIFVSSVEF